MVARGDGRLREGGGWVEWSEKMPRITKNSKPRLGDGWICSTCLMEEYVNEGGVNEEDLPPTISLPCHIRVLAFNLA